MPSQHGGHGRDDGQQQHHHQNHGQQHHDASSFLWGLNHFPNQGGNPNTNPYADNSAAIASLNLIQQPTPSVDPFHQMDVFNTPNNSDFGGSGETPSNLHGHGNGTGATPDSAAAQTFADQLALWTNANFSFDGPTGHALLGDDEDKDKPSDAQDDDVPIPDAVRSSSRNGGLGGAASGSNSRQASIAPHDARGRTHRQQDHVDPRDESRDRAARIGEPTHQTHKDQAVAAQQQHYFAPPNDADEARRPGKLAPSGGGPSRDRPVPNRTSSSRDDDAPAAAALKEGDNAAPSSRQNSISHFAPGLSAAANAFGGAGPGGLDMTSALALQHLITSAAGNPAFALAGLGAPHFNLLNGAGGHGISSPPPSGPNAAPFNALNAASFGGAAAAQNLWGALNPQQIQATLAAYLTAQAQASAPGPASAAHPLDPFANGGSAPEVAFSRATAPAAARHSRTQSVDVGDGGIGSGGLSAAGSSVAGDDEPEHGSTQRTKKARTSSSARSGSIPNTAAPGKVDAPESPNTMAAKLDRLEDDIPPLKLIDTGNPEADAEANRLAIEEDKRRRNTAASARFRIKKKQREAALEQSLRDLRTREQELEEENAALRTENGWLKSLITVRGVTGAGSGLAGAAAAAAAGLADGKKDEGPGGSSSSGGSVDARAESASSSTKGPAGAHSRDSGLHPRGVGTLSPTYGSGGGGGAGSGEEKHNGFNMGAIPIDAATLESQRNAARGFLNAAAIYGSQRAAAENKKRDRED